MSASDSEDDVRDDFDELVNMTAAELTRWLDSEQSRSVGVTGNGAKKSGAGGEESVGHDSGRHIVAILEKNKSDPLKG